MNTFTVCNYHAEWCGEMNTTNIRTVENKLIERKALKKINVSKEIFDFNGIWISSMDIT